MNAQKSKHILAMHCIGHILHFCNLRDSLTLAQVDGRLRELPDIARVVRATWEIIDGSEHPKCQHEAGFEYLCSFVRRNTCIASMDSIEYSPEVDDNEFGDPDYFWLDLQSIDAQRVPDMSSIDLRVRAAATYARRNMIDFSWELIKQCALSQFETTMETAAIIGRLLAGLRITDFTHELSHSRTSLTMMCASIINGRARDDPVRAECVRTMNFMCNNDERFLLCYEPDIKFAVSLAHCFATERCAAGDETMSEFIDCLCERDSTRAAACIPLHPDLILECMQGDRMASYIASAPFIANKTGPRFARYLYSVGKLHHLVAHISPDDGTFARCIGLLENGIFARSQYRSECLATAANNPDLRALDSVVGALKIHYEDRSIPRTSLGRREIVPIAWVPSMGFAALRDAITRLESRGFCASFEALANLDTENLHGITREELTKCFAFVFDADRVGGHIFARKILAKTTAWKTLKSIYGREFAKIFKEFE